jgi:hypothetical protein
VTRDDPGSLRLLTGSDGPGRHQSNPFSRAGLVADAPCCLGFCSTAGSGDRTTPVSNYVRPKCVDGRLSFTFYEGLLASDRQWLLIRNSFSLASVTTLFATAAGLALGILLGLKAIPERRREIVRGPKSRRWVQSRAPATARWLQYGRGLGSERGQRGGRRATNLRVPE